MKKQFIALSLVLSGFAEASCGGSTIDLRSLYPKVMNNITVKNQGNYGICYAYAGATIVDFYRMKATGKIGSEISPVESGILSAIYSESEDEEGGDICDVVNSLSERGKACPISAVGKESRYKDVGLFFHREVVSQVFLPYLNNPAIFKSVPAKNFQSRQQLTNEQKKYLSRFDSFYQSLKAELRKRGFDAANIPAPVDIFKFAQTAHIENKYYILSPSFSQSLISKSCQNSTLAVPRLSCETKEIGRTQMISEIDHQLDNFKRPVGISYCSLMLTSKTASGIDYYNKPKKNCGPHASVVIGKRQASSGECQYLIRNSWGESYKYPWEKSRGDVWVNERAMMMNVYKVHVTQ